MKPDPRATTPGAGLTALALAALATVLTATGCGRGETPVHVSQFEAFGSRVDIQIIGVPETLAAELSAETAADFTQLDYSLSLDQAGPMHRVNELLATGEPFPAPPSLLPLLQQSQTLAAASNNLFNPAIGMLTTLWQFDADTGDCDGPPDPEALKQIVDAAPTLSELSLNGLQLLSDDPAVKLDFGAVSRAYAADLAVANFRSKGVRGAMVRMGSDVRLIGNRTGQPWRIPVLRESGGAVLGVLDLSGDASLATVGRFQKPCIFEGTRYHRLLDPRTGYPATGSQSVTVLHPGDAVTAAAAATALFVAGPEHWHRVAHAMGITAALLIDEAGEIHLSPMMARHLTIIDRNARTRVEDRWNEPERG